MNYDEQLAELWIYWIADLIKLFMMIESGEFEWISWRGFLNVWHLNELIELTTLASPS